jgi:hypothetical protein
MADEAKVSREFIRWYQRLAAFKAVNLIGEINQNLGSLRRVIPTASEIIGLAVNEARQSTVPDPELAAR